MVASRPHRCLPLPCESLWIDRYILPPWTLSQTLTLIFCTYVYGSKKYIYVRIGKCVDTTGTVLLPWAGWRERKCAEKYNKWHNRIFLLNCNQHFGNFKRYQFPSVVWQDCFRIFYLKYILALKMASPGNPHCANCTLLFSISNAKM